MTGPGAPAPINATARRRGRGTASTSERSRGPNHLAFSAWPISPLVLATLVTGAFLAGCEGRIGDYVAASSIARKGFACDPKAVASFEGQEVRVWGFVDHRNLYGDAGAKGILREWWSGPGPSADTWRFDLLGRADDEPGQGFQVQVPNDPGRDERLRAFLADALAGRPTRVFVTGRLLTFRAPTTARVLTGLMLKPRSSGDIRLEPPWSAPRSSEAPPRRTGHPVESARAAAVGVIGPGMQQRDRGW